MNTYPARLPKFTIASPRVAPFSSSQAGAEPPPLPPLRFTAEESSRFLRIISSGALINRHHGIFQWLSGEVQQVLPHRMLIAAWGDFAKHDLKLDITSALPGVRTAQLARCSIHDFVHKAHAEWAAGGGQPVLLETADFAVPRACACPIHAALREMRSAVVHGIRDARGGNESLYIALDTESLGGIPRADGFKFLVHGLVAQMDVAFRRVAEFPLDGSKLSRASAAKWRDLSLREEEILGWLRRGDSNIDIALALGISTHTVKNHLQRIFRKIGVNNRTQAAAQYNEAIRASGEHV
jgi:transcriptional regulator EpsA